MVVHRNVQRVGKFLHHHPVVGGFTIGTQVVIDPAEVNAPEPRRVNRRRQRDTVATTRYGAQNDISGDYAEITQFVAKLIGEIH
jgi:hypothetical protein